MVGPALAVLVFPIYLSTLSPGVTAEDCGELAAAAAELGIVHPTGYPLFTILEWLFTRLPGPAPVIWKLNLSGAILCSVATWLFYRVLLLLLQAPAPIFGPDRKPGRAAGRGTDGAAARAGLSAGLSTGPHADKASAAIATLALSFSKLYWTEAVALEVYALHLVFLGLALWLYPRALEARAAGSASAPGRWALFAYALGLGFTNHMMMVLLAPAFLYLYFLVHGRRREAWTGIAIAAPPFLLGLSLYLYLPLRAAQSPLMNWGDPSTPEAFWQHFTGAQYRGQMFSSWDVAWRKLLQFSADFPPDFGYVPLAAALPGLWMLARHRPRLLVFSALIFAMCLFYASNYAFDDPNFYLNAYAATAIWIAYGVRALLRAAAGKWALPAALLGASVFLVPLALNYPLLDKSRDYAVEDYARNALRSADSGAVYFTNEYERLASPAFYLQQVEGFRRDVAVVDIVLLGSAWYYRHLDALHPWLFRGSREAVDAYLAVLDQFGRVEDFDTAAYNLRTEEMFRTLVANQYPHRSVYVSPGINPAVTRDYRSVPAGLAYRLVRPDDSTVRIAPMDFDFRPLPSGKANRLAEPIRDEYASAYGNQGVQSILRGDTAAGIVYLRRALGLNPDFPEAAQWLRDVTGP